mmetsp:Transcript_5202/g.12399  ORF Transcript_5202/g.12399 Transcript_5202/m.12399 type:complete len:232 (-) Transcript_5202:143-838(-)
MFSDVNQQAATQQVIGAAANDPRVQAAALEAAKEAAKDPRMQAAAWNAGRGAAESAAQQGASRIQAGFVEVRTYVQETHFSIRAYCFCAALALLVSSILGVCNVFSAVFQPYQYLWAIYNVIFAAIIIIIDGKPEWFARYGDPQAKIFMNASFLATWTGRAVLYFYVGSINIVLLPESFFWKLMYICIGAVLCSIALLMMLQGCGACGACSCCQAPGSRHKEAPGSCPQGP